METDFVYRLKELLYKDVILSCIDFTETRLKFIMSFAVFMKHPNVYFDVLCIIGCLFKIFVFLILNYMIIVCNG